MAQLVVSGALLECTMGTTPGVFIVGPVSDVAAEARPVGTVMDHAPQVNISTFGLCRSPANPAVAAATAAAAGTLTPQPCIPATATQWMPGVPNVFIRGFPALHSVSRCLCNWAGVISITNAGTMRTEVPEL